MKMIKRYRDVRIEITQDVFAEFAERFHIKVGEVMDGWLDKEGNFHRKTLTVYSTHFKILGQFVFVPTK